MVTTIQHCFMNKSIHREDMFVNRSNFEISGVSDTLPGHIFIGLYPQAEMSIISFILKFCRMELKTVDIR
jgi:hypothetical protein